MRWRAVAPAGERRRGPPPRSCKRPESPRRPPHARCRARFHRGDQKQGDASTDEKHRVFGRAGPARENTHGRAEQDHHDDGHHVQQNRERLEPGKRRKHLESCPEPLSARQHAPATEPLNHHRERNEPDERNRSGGNSSRRSKRRRSCCAMRTASRSTTPPSSNRVTSRAETPPTATSAARLTRAPIDSAPSARTAYIAASPTVAPAPRTAGTLALGTALRLTARAPRARPRRANVARSSTRRGKTAGSRLARRLFVEPIVEQHAMIGIDLGGDERRRAAISDLRPRPLRHPERRASPSHPPSIERDLHREAAASLAPHDGLAFVHRAAFVADEPRSTHG